MTEEELQVIEDRAARTTAGPWKHIGHLAITDSKNTRIPASAEDAEFLAAARADVLALVNEIRRMRNAKPRFRVATVRKGF